MTEEYENMTMADYLTKKAQTVEKERCGRSSLCVGNHFPLRWYMRFADEPVWGGKEQGIGRTGKRFFRIKWMSTAWITHRGEGDCEAHLHRRSLQRSRVYDKAQVRRVLQEWMICRRCIPSLVGRSATTSSQTVSAWAGILRFPPSTERWGWRGSLIA